MRGHGIAGALWTVARRQSASGGISTVLLLIILTVALAAATTARADVEYEYTGNDFTVADGLFTTADSVTGDVILNNSLPPSQSTSPSVVSYSFSDGVDTFTNTNSGNNGFTFTTNAAGQVTSAVTQLQLNSASPSAPSAEILIDGTGGDLANHYDLLNPNDNGMGTSPTPGMWSGPTSVGSGGGGGGGMAPSLYMTVQSDGAESLSLQPTHISASLILATTPPANSTLVATLPAGITTLPTTLAQAANDLGYSGFAWEQTMTTVPPPNPLSGCANPTCSLPVSLMPPYNDPPQYGYYSYPTSLNTYPFYIPGFAADQILEGTSTTLSFGDSPNDACISGPVAPSPGYVIIAAQAALAGAPAPCGGVSNLASWGSYLGFTTTLVGVTSAPGCIDIGTCVDLAGFTWTDNFDGINTSSITGGGGVSNIANFSSDVEADPSTGEGGVTIVSIDGEPVAEPSSVILLISSTTFLILIAKWRKYPPKVNG